MAKNFGEESEIHGLLCEVSPMKKGKGISYFDGKISDGSHRIRLFGFDNNTRKRPAEVSGSAVVFANCEIKRGRYGDDYEVSIQGLGHLTYYVYCVLGAC